MKDDIAQRLEAKIDVIVDRIGSIDVTLVKQHESLKHHIKRTEILEQELRPIKKHVSTVSAIMKITGFMIGLIGVAAAVIEALK